MALRPPAPASSWLFIVLWAAVILLFSLTVPPPGVSALPDKLVHAAAYAGLALLLRARLAAGGSRRAAALAIVVAVGYGAAIEGVQGLLPWRRADGWDLVANLIGAAVAAVPVVWRRTR